MDACHAYTVRESLGAPLREVMAWLSNLELMSLIQPEVSISSLDPSLTLQEGTRWVEARVGNASLFLRPSADAECIELTPTSIGIAIDDKQNRIMLRWQLAPGLKGSTTDITQTVEAFCWVGSELRESEKLARMLRKQDMRIQRLKEALQLPSSGATAHSEDANTYSTSCMLMAV